MCCSQGCSPCRWLAGNAQPKPAGAPTVLKPGKSISQTPQSGQAFDYQVALKAGQALKATVEQKGVDVLVTAYGPDGTKLATFDSPTSTAYKEFVTVLAPATGRYRLSVPPFAPNAPAGTFVMTLDGILTPDQCAQRQADDRQRADAVAAYLQTPHPDQTAYEQREEMLRLDPGAYMLAAPPRTKRPPPAGWKAPGRPIRSCFHPHRARNCVSVPHHRPALRCPKPHDAPD